MLLTLQEDQRLPTWSEVAVQLGGGASGQCHATYTCSHGTVRAETVACLVTINTVDEAKYNSSISSFFF